LSNYSQLEQAKQQTQSLSVRTSCCT